MKKYNKKIYKANLRDKKNDLIKNDLILISSVILFNLAFLNACSKKNDQPDILTSKIIISNSKNSNSINNNLDDNFKTYIPDDNTSIHKNSQDNTQDNTQNNKIEYENLMLVNKDNSLPENFEPDLAKLDDRFYFDSNALSYLVSMIQDAKKDNINLFVVSAYRSNERQEQIFNNKLESLLKAGFSQEEAYQNTALYIALPGTSEHATGLAVDLNSLEEDFDQTPEFNWLVKHAADYGFILRYTKEKQDITKIAYEPWHYRYVGKKHAKKIMSLNICLEEYLNNYLNKK